MRCIICFFALMCATAYAAPVPLNKLALAAREARQVSDARMIEVYRAGLAKTFAYASTQTQLFPPAPVAKRLLAEADKTTARSIWKSALDYHLGLEGIEQFHGDFFKLTHRATRERSLALAYAAHTARYAFALDFIARVENDTELAKILNESVGDLGLEAGAYDRFKLHFLNVAQGSQFAALTTAYKTISRKASENLAASSATDAERIWQMARGKGVTMTLANALTVIRNLGQRAVFPAQAGVSAWMGDTRVHRQHQALISDAQIAALTKKLLPGDVMLQRREWYVSNVGLPGFWSHAALYIGTPQERLAFFTDAEVAAWVKSQGVADGEFETLLKMRYAKAYATSIAAQEHGHVPRVLEAMSEGVSFTTIEHSAAADSLAALRPRLSKVERANAILRAFNYAGRPYDFDFDFQTDASLVCTELIYKSYEPAANIKGIRMQPSPILGRLAIPANDYANAFDKEYGTPNQQWDLISFLDGSERRNTALEADLGQFRTSGKRPKWHIMLPDSTTTKAVKRS